MQCGIEERVVRGMRTIAVRCFRCREEGHKCRECPLWEKKENRVARLSQTSFGHIFINSSLILTVSMATESP